MCIGGGSTDKKWRRKIQISFYFLYALEIVIVAISTSYETIPTPQRTEVCSIFVVQSNIPIFGPLWTSITNVISSIFCLYVPIRDIKVPKISWLFFYQEIRSIQDFYDVVISIKQYIYITL